MTEIHAADAATPVFGAAGLLPGVLVLGCGNPSRGDDALGPMLLERLADRFGTAADPRVELMADFQLQIEHALDIQDRGLVLFVDASVGCLPPFDFEEIEPRRDASFSSHAMSPQAVLAVCREVLGRRPPPSFLLSIRGDGFGLGAPLSDRARGHLECAVALAAALCAEPTLGYWRARSRSKGS